MNKIITVVCIASVGFLTACGRPVEQQSEQPVETAEVTVFTDTAPTGDPTPIPEARTQFKPGEEVLLEGLVMGSPSPFVEGRAIFILGDRGTLTPCNAMETDHCPTPWDVCCDPPELRQKGTVAIQVVDENNKVLPVGLKGMNGLTELSKVNVVGTVAPMSTPEGFIVNATALHVVK